MSANAPASAPLADVTLAPVAPQERLETLDILRGFALFGVLLINMRNFDLPGHVWTGAIDHSALWVTVTLFAGKSWRLFSFLFGLGFALQIARAQGQGAPFVRLYLRRLAVLFIFGCFHKLIYDGDILVDYALLGLALLPLYRRSSKTILLVAALFFLIPVVQSARDVQAREVAGADPQRAQVIAREAQQREVERAARRADHVRLMTTASFQDYVVFLAKDFGRRYASLEAYEEMFGDSFPIFLLGLYAGRRRLLQQAHAYLARVRKALSWGLALGLACTLASIAGQWPPPWASATPAPRNFSGLLWFAGAPLLSLAYAAAIILLAQTEGWRKRFAPLASVGRMPLSNYLLQSAIFTPMFLGWGLGLYGQVGPALNVLVTLLIYSFNIAFSGWWLAHFRLGPLEWLWRSAAYGKWQPMRVEPAPLTAGVANAR